MTDDCVFCKIVEGKSPSQKIYEDDDSIVIKNIHPVAETHLLVIPKKHIENFLDKELTIEPLKIAAQKVITDLGLEKGYKLGINGGQHQSVGHFHIHILAGKLENEDDVFNKT
jgi:histidine triad (HIT) family protein